MTEVVAIGVSRSFDGPPTGTLQIHQCFWQPLLCEIDDAQNYLLTEGLNIHQSARKIRAVQDRIRSKTKRVRG
ncbi:hypothetical protein TNCV_1441531 [Trichonephila clavipes]|uniref:Uncharacterized protein n=1 Tax=Trichonephila clavipes TaxID=2585209 RepID=A0A8X6V806_TRICX|nr:hypothetical protein TNCV_1441531 [Trichonephila clavipes]